MPALCCRRLYVEPDRAGPDGAPICARVGAGAAGTRQLEGSAADRDGMNEPLDRAPVLIAGGGPIGLALAADLGRRGVRRCWSRSARTSCCPPRCWRSVSAPWSSAASSASPSKVRNWGFPLDWPLDSVFVTDMRGYELGRVRTPALGEMPHSEFSPERGRPCPQTWFDPILQDCARSYPHVTLRHRRKLESFVQDDDGVTATLRDQHDRPHRDGARGAIWSAAMDLPALCASSSASRSAASRTSTGR